MRRGGAGGWRGGGDKNTERKGKDEKGGKRLKAVLQLHYFIIIWVLVREYLSVCETYGMDDGPSADSTIMAGYTNDKMMLG